jgi:hypothetical protein
MLEQLSSRESFVAGAAAAVGLTKAHKSEAAAAALPGCNGAPRPMPVHFDVCLALQVQDVAVQPGAHLRPPHLLLCTQGGWQMQLQDQQRPNTPCGWSQCNAVWAESASAGAAACRLAVCAVSQCCLVGDLHDDQE